MSGPTSYSLFNYGAMVTCEPRMSAYAEALRQSITPGCTVIDIGAGPGVFSLLACKYGAGRVIAIEPDDSVELLRQLAADNGCLDRIAIVQGLSTDYEPPAKADVIISDLRGCLPLFEGHISTIVDARERLLALDGKLIPAKDHLRIALAHSPKDNSARQEPWAHNRLGLDLSGGGRFAVNSWTKVTLGADALLCEPSVLATLDYCRIAEPNLGCTVELAVSRPGTAHGFLVWFDTELAPGIGFSNAPGEPPQIYGQTFLPLEQAVDVALGDRITVEFTANLVDRSYVWGWNSRFLKGGGEKPFAVFRQSSFLSKLISPQSLKPCSSGHVPTPSDAQKQDLLCLSLFDGKRSLGNIAEELHAQFPDRFASTVEALNHVASLTARYR